jgi:hypothetical protein
MTIAGHAAPNHKQTLQRIIPKGMQEIISFLPLNT